MKKILIIIIAVFILGISSFIIHAETLSYSEYYSNCELNFYQEQGINVCQKIFETNETGYSSFTSNLQMIKELKTNILLIDINNINFTNQDFIYFLEFAKEHNISITGTREMIYETLNFLKSPCNQTGAIIYNSSSSDSEIKVDACEVNNQKMIVISSHANIRLKVDDSIRYLKNNKTGEIYKVNDDGTINLGELGAYQETGDYVVLVDATEEDKFSEFYQWSDIYNYSNASYWLSENSTLISNNGFTEYSKLLEYLNNPERINCDLVFFNDSGSYNCSKLIEIIEYS